MSSDNSPQEEIRVVVVDDHRDSADVMLLLLKALKINAKAAYNAADALALVRSFNPHCVLSDIEMPEMNGYELAKQIRSSEEFRDIPLIAISGNADPKLVIESGFNYHLTKPAAALTLTALLKKILHAGTHLEQAERLLKDQKNACGEARELLREVKVDVEEIKSDIEDMKRDVKEIKDDLREATASDIDPLPQ